MRSTSLSRLGFALPLSLLLGACSSSSPSAPPADAGPPTFTEVYETILEPYCSQCHATGGPYPFLMFDTQAHAYAALVNVKADGQACGTSGLTRVVPGNSATSLLYLKVSEVNPPCGSQMPFTGTPLTPPEQALIQTWIDEGAPND